MIRNFNIALCIFYILPFGLYCKYATNILVMINNFNMILCIFFILPLGIYLLNMINKYKKKINEIHECTKEMNSIYEYVDKIDNIFLDKNELDINVYILGDNGRLGKLIKNELEKYTNFKYIRGIGKDMNIENITEINSVIVDVSQPEGTVKLLTELIDKQTYCPLIIGTTGHIYNDTFRLLLEKYSLNAPIAICSNFSKGIIQIKKIIDVINKNKWNVSMNEKHHINKKDAPSGTAKMLAKYYGKEEMEIISIREGEIIGEHELILENKNEIIKINHSVKSRNVFAEGCIEWIKWLTIQKNGIYYEMK